ncbi:hypothetical protein FHR23_001743 [Stakelama sediminis]|uniref:Uncharacterized protein n=1 Tax=Stakelama sediminis TaxID=463200 RepID=A0A840YZ73_9SPHN|nr:hypothetical protein [Stakelama sediminis]
MRSLHAVLRAVAERFHHILRVHSVEGLHVAQTI